MIVISLFKKIIDKITDYWQILNVIFYQHNNTYYNSITHSGLLSLEVFIKLTCAPLHSSLACTLRNFSM